jgi:hypothetical protein
MKWSSSTLFAMLFAVCHQGQGTRDKEEVSGNRDMEDVARGIILASFSKGLGNVPGKHVVPPPGSFLSFQFIAMRPPPFHEVGRLTNV